MMRPAAAAENPALEPMAPDLAGRVTAFARACKAAARSVALYPGEHPAVAAALAAVTSAAEAATAGRHLPLAVRPDALTVEGRALARPDATVADFAALLHQHQVGQLTLLPQTDAGTWRRFLALLALPPDQARVRGGIGSLWASEGESRIEIRSLDYGELLRSRLHGDEVTWDAIIARCLEGSAFSLDQGLVEMLFGVLQDPESILAVMRALESRLPPGTTAGQGAAVMAGLLQAVAEFVAATTPDEADNVMAALAEAATRLPLDTLGTMVEGPRGGFSPNLGQFIQNLLRRATDGSIANFIASEVRGGHGSSPRLADAFCGLAPEPHRRSAILALARNSIEEKGASSDPALVQAWQQTEGLLLAYSDKAFVSDEYNVELGHLIGRAVDLDRDHTDPVEVMAAWRGTVGDESLRLLDAALIADLMNLQRDLTLWRDLAGLVLERVSMLLVVGDFPAAALLAEALRGQSESHCEPEIRGEAAETLHNFLTPSTMRHVASHLDTSDRRVVEAARRFCLALGTIAIRPLAEVLSREERNRPRRHLIDVLTSFGASGREAVESLRQSPNAAVRRTAVLLLREFGGQEALPELESLLDDAEPHVQREATRAIATLGIDSAYDTLVRALERGTERARTSILGVLWTLPHEDAEQVLSHLAVHAPCRATMWAVHERVVERLGTVGGRTSVDALSAVLQRRSVWSPFRMRSLRRLAIDALAKIGSPEAIGVIQSSAASGTRAVRAAARASLEALAARQPREERPA
ncbi:MAG: HEAT repeat domain-containing protein [Vicinamibacterales bacterium]